MTSLHNNKCEESAFIIYEYRRSVCIPTNINCQSAYIEILEISLHENVVELLS